MRCRCAANRTLERSSVELNDRARRPSSSSLSASSRRPGRRRGDRLALSVKRRTGRREARETSPPSTAAAERPDRDSSQQQERPCSTLSTSSSGRAISIAPPSEAACVSTRQGCPPRAGPGAWRTAAAFAMLARRRIDWQHEISARTRLAAWIDELHGTLCAPNRASAPNGASGAGTLNPAPGPVRLPLLDLAGVAAERRVDLAAGDRDVCARRQRDGDATAVAAPVERCMPCGCSMVSRIT